MAAAAASPVRKATSKAVLCFGLLAESLVPYAEWYYCHVGQSNVVLRWLYVVSGSEAYSGP